MSKRKLKTGLIDSDSNNESDPDTSDSGSDWDSRKRKKRKLNGTKSSKKLKQKVNTNSPDESDSEPEEGEVTGDTDSSNELSSELEFDDGLDENLIGDEDDRARLDQMTEKEREQEIYNRVEKREVMRARFEIEKKLRLAKKQQQKKKKDVSDRLTKSSASGMTDRKKAMEESKGKRDKFADLKARREDRLQKAEEREKKEKEAEEKKKMKEVSQEPESESEKSEKESKTSKQKLKASDVFSSDSSAESDEEIPAAKPSKRVSSSSSSSSSSSESESERSDAEEKKKKKEEEEKFIWCKEDLEKIRLSRHKIGIYVHLPLFNKAAVGCFVRIGIGKNNENNQPVYRVGQILEVVETSKIYKLENTRTNKGVRLRHGNQERIFRLEFVSNSRIQTYEFEKWLTSCKVNDVPLPKMDHITKKQKDINDLLNYQFSNDDINHMVEQKARFSENPTNYAVAKTILLKERELANQRGDDISASKISTQIAELDDKATILHKKRTSTIASISYINERNRKNNVEKAEKAIRIESEERKQQTADPFTRRSTRPKIMSMGEKKEQVMTSELLKKLEEERAVKEEREIKRKEEEAIRKKAEEEKQKLEARNKKDPGYDPFAAHDFDIKINVDVSNPASIVPISRPSTSTPLSNNNLSILPKKNYK